MRKGHPQGCPFCLDLVAKRQQKKQQKLCCFRVGAAGLELATACTPCKNASQLHHAPICAAKIGRFFQLATISTKYFIFAD